MVVFVGGFSHLPNVDAALWLGKEIMPFPRRSAVNSAGAHELLWRGTPVGQPMESDSMRCTQA